MREPRNGSSWKVVATALLTILFIAGYAIPTVEAKNPKDNDLLIEILDLLGMELDVNVGSRASQSSVDTLGVHKATVWRGFDLSVAVGDTDVFHIANCGTDGVCTGRVNGVVLTDDPDTFFLLGCVISDGVLTALHTLETYQGSTIHRIGEDFACPRLTLQVTDGNGAGGSDVEAILTAGYVATDLVTLNAEP